MCTCLVIFCCDRIVILFLKDECDGVGFTVMCNRIKKNYVQTSVYGYAVHVCDVSACLCVRMLYISLYMYVYGVCVYVPVYVLGSHLEQQELI